MNSGLGKLLINCFNEICNNIANSYLNVGDESMSAIHFLTMANRNLPHLSYIFRKPKPLGTEFKTVACYVTGALIFIELHRGKQGFNNSN